MSQQFKESETIQKILAALVFNDKNLLKKKRSTKTKPAVNSENAQTDNQDNDLNDKNLKTRHPTIKRKAFGTQDTSDRR